MCVADRHLPRPVVIERLDEPDARVVIMHLRRAITCGVAAQHGVVLLDRAEQIPWRRAFGAGLHVPDADLYSSLPPEVQGVIATPDQIPPEVRLPTE